MMKQGFSRIYVDYFAFPQLFYNLYIFLIDVYNQTDYRGRKMLKRIGVLTSGGDAPGMNAAIRAVTLAGHKHGLEVYGIVDGYKGLVEDNLILLEDKDVFGIQSRGGTFLGTARLPEFKELAVREKAVANLKKRGIEALVVIGGDGSYTGALRLTEMGINCVGLPGTIDNDIACTDYTIGFDTCMNTISYAIDHLRDTSFSHARCAVVEIMGNHCGDLTLFSGLADGADVIITPDHLLSKEEVVAKLKAKENEKRCAIVLVAEKMKEINVKELADYINANTKYIAKSEVLGRIQRGGTPSAFDRVLASSMGVFAVNKLVEGKGGICVGLHQNKLVTYEIEEALSMVNDKNENIFALSEELR